MNKRLILLALGVSATALASLLTGPTVINPLGMDGPEREILLMIRLPRIVVALMIGAALGASGAVLQGILRNPLADPYILGLSSGAALLATAGLVLGLGTFATPTLAFVGAALSGLIVGILGTKRGAVWPDRLLLAGIGLGFLFSAILMLMLSVSTDSALRRAVLWMFGDLSVAEWPLIPLGAVFIAGGLFIALGRAKAINVLMLGDDLAHSLGFSPARERAVLFVSVCLMTSASVAMGGMVGFIGLLMPHIVRFWVGSDNRALLPAAALSGGALLVVADHIGRTVLHPMELPSGMVTAIIGAPYFLWLLKKKDILHG